MHGFCPLKIKITQFPGGFRLEGQSHELRMCGPKLIFQDLTRLKKAAASGRGGHRGKRRNSGRQKKKTISDLKRCKREWFQNLQRSFLENNIFQSWLTTKFEAEDYFCQWVIFMIIFMTLSRRQAKDESEAKVRRGLISVICFVLVSICFFFSFQCWLSIKTYS